MSYIDIISLQIVLKARGSMKYPEWHRDFNEYKRFCLYIAKSLRNMLPKSMKDYHALLERYIKEVEKAQSREEILALAVEVWRASNFLLDLTP